MCEIYVGDIWAHIQLKHMPQSQRSCDVCKVLVEAGAMESHLWGCSPNLLMGAPTVAMPAAQTVPVPVVQTVPAPVIQTVPAPVVPGNESPSHPAPQPPLPGESVQIFDTPLFSERNNSFQRQQHLQPLQQSTGHNQAVNDIPTSANIPPPQAAAPTPPNNSRYCCTECAKQFSTAAGLQQHRSAKKHKKPSSDSSPATTAASTASTGTPVLIPVKEFVCTDCVTGFSSAVGLQQHQSSKKHKKRAQQKAQASSLSPAAAAATAAASTGIVALGPVEYFFASHDFPLDPTANYEAEFMRLCNFHGWPVGSSQMAEARTIFRAAQVKAFGSATVNRVARARQAAVKDAIREFFEDYGFAYNPEVHYREEFERLCRENKWSKKSKQRKEAKQLLGEAEVADFGEMFGTDPNDPEAWRMLCDTAGIRPIPEGLEGRRQVCFSLTPPITLF